MRFSRVMVLLLLSGFVSTPAIAQLEGKVYALCVGISDYQKPVDGLRSPCRDAAAMAELFESEFGYETEKITDPKTTLSTIRSRIAHYSANLTAADSFIFYFSGHGASVGDPIETVKQKHAYRTGFMIPRDFKHDIGPQIPTTKRLKIFEREAVNMRSLSADLTKIKALHVVMVLDCCFSGLAAGVKGGSFRIREGQVYRTLMSKKSRTVVCAATGSQTALEVPSQKLSLFTHYLREELSAASQEMTKAGKGRLATLSDLFVNVRTRVIEHCEKNRLAEMTPIMRQMTSDPGEFVFVPNEVRKSKKFQKIVNYSPGRKGSGKSKGHNDKAISESERKELDEAVKESKKNKRRHENTPVWRERAARYDRRASRGDERAMAALSICYAHGVGVPRREKLSRNWAWEANDSGSVEGVEAWAHVNMAFGMGKQDAGMRSLLAGIEKRGGNDRKARAIGSLLAAIGKNGKGAGSNGGNPQGSKASGGSKGGISLAGIDFSGKSFRQVLNSLRGQFSGPTNWEKVGDLHGDLQSKIKDVLSAAEKSGRNEADDISKDLQAKVKGLSRRKMKRMSARAIKKKLDEMEQLLSGFEKSIGIKNGENSR